VIGAGGSGAVGSIIGGLGSLIGWNAKGGTFIADKPTIQGFGEAGPELVTAIPLNRLGKSANTSPIGSLAGAGGGNVNITLDLSPDLEGRIVANSLDQMANVVMRTRRTK
jgi:hypothetical protein